MSYNAGLIHLHRRWSTSCSAIKTDELFTYYWKWRCCRDEMRDTTTNLILARVSVIVLRVLSMIQEWSTLNTPQYIYSTWSHKNTYLCALSVRHRFMYRTARFTAISKRNVHWVALKHRLNTWKYVNFVDIGRYCCVFIMFLQVRIAAVQNIRGLFLKVNTLSCWKYHQTQP